MAKSLCAGSDREYASNDTRREIERRVAQRTSEVTAANEQLRQAIFKRRRIEKIFRTHNHQLEKTLRTRTFALTQEIKTNKASNNAMSNEFRAALEVINK
jgi:C4-dicarboxylate-specific signal transduction histidine kinase